MKINLKISKRLGILILIIILVILVILIAYCWTKQYIKDNLDTGGQSINEFLEKRCSDPTVFNSRDFEWSSNFRKNWMDVRKEFEDYSRDFVVPSYRDVNKESSANIAGWKALFLRVFNVDTKMMQHFPKTKQLLEKLPRNQECTTAYFSMMEPGTHLPAHRGVYKGVIRYHLGLIVPHKWQDCFIVVDGKKLHWKEGDDIMFDDMALHHVENNTDQQRVVLFLDIKRDFKSMFLNWVNNLMLKFIKCNDALLSTVEKANLISRQTPKDYSNAVADLRSQSSTPDIVPDDSSDSKSSRDLQNWVKNSGLVNVGAIK